MGNDPGAVVDPRIEGDRRRGPARRRRLDHAEDHSGNTNAPTIMIAEKGAEMVLADAKVAVRA